MGHFAQGGHGFLTCGINRFANVLFKFGFAVVEAFFQIFRHFFGVFGFQLTTMHHVVHDVFHGVTHFFSRHDGGAQADEERFFQSIHGVLSFFVGTR